MSVLDVGCGTGAITRGIAEAVGEDGHVLGIDRSSELIELARRRHRDLTSLSFEALDLNHFVADGRFDLVTSSRFLQWQSDPLAAVKSLAQLVTDGGRVVVLDYNHEKVRWDPSPPPACLHFYEAFLAWRTEAGFDNAIADRLGQLLDAAGLSEVSSSDQTEIASSEQRSFASAISLWPDVVATRGHQLVADRYLTEQERRAAEDGFRAWTANARRQELNLVAADGRVARASEPTE